MGTIMLAAGALMAAALAASALAGRLRIPGLLLFLGIGMAIGSDGLGLVNFGDYEMARDVGIVALALILFEGGLTTNVEQLRKVAKTAASLAIIGTLLTAGITGIAASALFDLPILQGLLLGSIVASTDAAAIFAMLRYSGLEPRITRILEGESGANDPVAILLVIGFIDWIMQPDYGVSNMLTLFVGQLAIGAVAGIAVGWLTVMVMRRVDLPTVGLYPVASLTAGGLAFGIADVLGGSGFLSIYLAGLTMSAVAIPAKRTITAFHDGLAWVAQLGMFLTLGLLVFPSQFGSIALQGTVLALVLVFVSRPIASVLATAFSQLGLGERAILGWAGLRGAVPVVLATFPVIAGVPNSLEYFDIIFFAVVLTLIAQGPTFEPFARWLNLTSVEPVLPRPLAEMGTVRGLGAEIVDFEVGESDAVDGALVRDLGLPREAVVNVIVRGTDAVPPRGSTRVQAGDHLHLLVRSEVSGEVEDLVNRWRHGPIGPQPRPQRRFKGVAPIFTVRRNDDVTVEGDMSNPAAVLGNPVVAQLRTRRDAQGSLVALDDGRYAVVGEMVVVGSRDDIATYAHRRLRTRDGDDHSWLQTVIGALAVDAFD